MRRGTRNLLYGAFLLALLGLGSALIFLQTPNGSSWLQKRLLAWADSELGIALSFDEASLTYSALGPVLRLKGARWSYTQERFVFIPSARTSSATVSELQLQLSPWGLLAGTQPVSELRLHGLQLQATLSETQLRIPALGIELGADSLRSWLDDQNTASKPLNWQGPQLIWDDVTLEVSLETEANALPASAFPLQLAGLYNPEHGLRRFSVRSEGFDITQLLLRSGTWAERLGLAERLALPLELAQQLRRGQVEKFSLSCDPWPICTGEAHLQAWSWDPWHLVPGLRNLEAHVRLENGEIIVDLPAGERHMEWLMVYPKLFPLDFGEARLRIKPTFSLWQVAFEAAHGSWFELPVQLHGDFKGGRTQGPELNLNIELAETSLESAQAALPTALMSAELSDWLRQHLQGGELQNIHAQLQGPLAAFPFQQSSEGSFKVQGTFKGVQLNYHPAWPALEACHGQVSLDATQLQIEKLHCQHGAVRVADGEVQIEDLLAKPAQLRVGFSASSSLAEALTYLSASPLTNVAKLLPQLGLQAPLQKTEVQLFLPISGEGQLTLKGKVTVAKGEIALPKGFYRGRFADLDLSFDQNGLVAANAQLNNDIEPSRLQLQRHPSRDQIDLELSPLRPGVGALMGHLSLSPAASPELVSGSFTGLKLPDGAARLELPQLRWHRKSPEKTKFQGEALVENFGILLQQLELNREYRGGKGRVNFDLESLGGPGDIDASSLTGKVEVAIEDGRILKLNSLLATFIKIANLTVFGLGATSLDYKTLKAHLTFKDGLMKTDDAALNLGSIEIRGKGTINGHDQSVDMTLQVVPNLGSPGAAIAIGLWNPIVGAALYGLGKLSDKASDSRLNRAFSQSYKLDGKLDDPKIKLSKPFDLSELTR